MSLKTEIAADTVERGESNRSVQEEVSQEQHVTNERFVSTAVHGEERH